MNEFSSAMDNVKNSMNEAKEKLINWFFFNLPYLQPSFYHFTTWLSDYHQIKLCEMIEINVHALFWIFKTSSSACSALEVWVNGPG